MFAKDLTSDQLLTISIIERVSASLSLIGICFIISTYLLYPSFHKPITRLIFYATAGNLFTCVGTLISRSAINGTSIIRPTLCKTQAFLIQAFMPADALWAFVMALNVYFTFYWKFESTQLKTLEIWYCVCAYGIPFILAFLLLWVSTEERGPMYGNANLWCWISGNWDHYRMYLFYGPVWAICIGTFVIYTRLVGTLLVNYWTLHGFNNHNTPPPSVARPAQNIPITGLRTTDISFHSEPAVMGRPMLGDIRLNQYRRPTPMPRAYNCQITGGDEISAAPASTLPKNGPRITATEIPRPNANPGSAPTAHLNSRNTGFANTALRVMGTVALFFFFIMLITWIPSSANRLFSVVHPKQVDLGLQYVAACVLPLQGFWNCLIYIYVSQESCRKLWRSLKSGRPWTWKDVKDSMKDAFVDNYLRDHFLGNHSFDEPASRTSTVVGRPLTSEDDSVTLLESLQNSRRNSSRPVRSTPDYSSIL